MGSKVVAFDGSQEAAIPGIVPHRTAQQLARLCRPARLRRLPVHILDDVEPTGRNEGEQSAKRNLLVVRSMTGILNDDVERPVRFAECSEESPVAHITARN